MDVLQTGLQSTLRQRHVMFQYLEAPVSAE
jgi:hypothetical protein